MFEKVLFGPKLTALVVIWRVRALNNGICYVSTTSSLIKANMEVFSSSTSVWTSYNFLSGTLSQKERWIKSFKGIMLHGWGLIDWTPWCLAMGSANLPESVGRCWLAYLQGNSTSNINQTQVIGASYPGWYQNWEASSKTWSRVGYIVSK